jgi:hypothetical protein
MLIAFVITVSFDFSFSDPGNRRCRCPGIQHHRLAFLDQPGCRQGNLHLLPAVQLLFLAQRRIEQRPGLQRQRTAVSTLDDPLSIEELEILADCDLRSAEVSSQLLDQQPSIPMKNFKDFTAAFFIEQAIRRHGVFSDLRVNRNFFDAILRTITFTFV